MGRLKTFFTKEKINAFLIHLGLSLSIFLVLLYFILFEWYPQPLFSTDGGWQGIRLLAFVDIVLGPLLTLIVFKKAKPRLKLDLSIIAAIQLGALISGTLVVYGEHPVAIIFQENRLYTVTADEVKAGGIALTSLKQYSDYSPPLIYTHLPEKPNELLKLYGKVFKEKRDFRLLGELYEKITEKNKAFLKQKATSLDNHLKNRPSELTIYKKFIAENKYKNRSLLYFPMYARYQHGFAVLDADTFEVIDVLNVTPPQ